VLEKEVRMILDVCGSERGGWRCKWWTFCDFWVVERWLGGEFAAVFCLVERRRRGRERKCLERLVLNEVK